MKTYTSFVSTLGTERSETFHSVRRPDILGISAPPNSGIVLFFLSNQNNSFAASESLITLRTETQIVILNKNGIQFADGKKQILNHSPCTPSSINDSFL